MHRKINLYFVLAFSALFLTMCRFYDQGARLTPLDGLGCQAYTDYFEEGLGISKGLECYYACPDRTVVGPVDFETDPSFSFSEGDLDRTLCGVVPQFTPTISSEENSPTPAASETPALSPTPEDSATPQASPTPDQPLLTGQTTMCDLGANLINFRMVEPVPDLTDKTLIVEIADTETTCAVNPTNPSLLTCTIPPLVTFPARIVVNLDDAIVNDFIYQGIGCDELTTPIPTTTP
ncbi:MAG TPA: hypothetical protein VFZ43_11175 [Anaerolineales bacterium]